MEIQFLELDEVLEIHQDQIRRYGGDPGVRDMGLLQSALAMPSAGFGSQYYHKDIYEMAAAYLFHIVQNHAFIDGNKRVAALAAYIFLRMNQIQLTAKESNFENLVRKASQGKSDKQTIALFFRKNSKKI